MMAKRILFFAGVVLILVTIVAAVYWCIESISIGQEFIVFQKDNILYKLEVRNGNMQEIFRPKKATQFYTFDLIGNHFRICLEADGESEYFLLNPANGKILKLPNLEASFTISPDLENIFYVRYEQSKQLPELWQAKMMLDFKEEKCSLISPKKIWEGSHPDIIALQMSNKKLFGQIYENRDISQIPKFAEFKNGHFEVISCEWAKTSPKDNYYVITTKIWSDSELICTNRVFEFGKAKALAQFQSDSFIWSKDESKIAFTKKYNDKHFLQVLDVKNGIIEEWGAGEPLACYDWSSDSKRILATREDLKDYHHTNICVVDKNSVSEVTSLPGSEIPIAWLN